MIEKTTKKYARNLKNSKKIRTLSIDETRRQYNGIYRLIANTSTQEFYSLSIEDRKLIIKDLDAFNGAPPTREEIKNTHRAILSNNSRNQAIKGVLIATNSIADSLTMVVGTAGLVLCVIPNPYRAIGCYLFGTNALSMFNLGGNLILGNPVLNEKKLKYSTNILLNDFTDNIYEKFLQSDDFDLSTIYPDFEFSLNTSSSITSDLQEVIESEKDQRFLNLLIRLDSLDIHNEEDLNNFLLEYAEEVGKKQKEALQNILEHKNNERVLIKEREKIALYNSLNGLVSTIITPSMGESEGILFNGLLNAGTQYLIMGALGPAGWAAIGLVVATKYIQNSNNSNFNKILFNALGQIQLQLDLIIKSIENILETQVDIIVQLNELYKVSFDTNKIVKVGLKEIKLDQKIKNQIFELVQIETIADKFEKASNNLHAIIFENVELDELREIYIIKNILLSELDNYVFTGRGLQYLTGKQLTELILPTATNNRNKKIKQLLSLYKFISLTNLFTYDDNLINFNSKKIVHPNYFHDYTQVIIQWLIQGGLPNNTKKEIINDILLKAISSKNIINQCSDFKIVEAKIESYKNHMNSLLNEIRKKFKELEFKEFSGKKDPIRKEIVLKSGGSSINTIKNVRSIILKQDKKMINNFLDNKTDIPLITYCIECQIIKSVKTIKSRIASHLTSYKNGEKFFYHSADRYTTKTKIIAEKNNIIEFNNVFLDFKKNLKISFKIKYQSKIMGNHFDRHHNGIHTYVKNLEFSFNWEENWKDMFTENIKIQLGPDIEINNILPNFKYYTPRRLFHHLLNQWILSKKSEFAYNVIDSIIIPHQDLTDRIGTELLYLSKLNELVTSNERKPFLNDYIDEVYCTEDLINIINYYIDFRFQAEYLYEHSYIHEVISVYDNLIKEWKNKTQERADVYILFEKNPFYLFDVNNRKSEPLNPEHFVDMMVIYLNKGIQRTIRNCRKKIKEINYRDAEPFLADTINTLLWYHEVFINKELVEPIYPSKRMEVFSRTGEMAQMIYLKPIDKYFDGKFNINIAYSDYKNKLFFPWCLLIDIWYKDMNQDYLPSELEEAKLEQIHESIINILNAKTESHFLGIVEAVEYQTIIFYSDSELDLSKEFNRNSDFFEGREINTTIFKDPLWDTIAEFVK